MIQIAYVNGDNKINFRQSKGSNDVSGDYNQYEESNIVTVGDLQVTMKGNDGKVNLATWVDGEYSFMLFHGSIEK